MSTDDSTHQQGHVPLDPAHGPAGLGNHDDDLDAVTDQSTQPAQELRWHIEAEDPTNPFTQRLVFSEGDTPVLWMGLDPVTLRQFHDALSVVLHDQIQALTGQPPAPAPAAVATATPTYATYEDSDGVLIDPGIGPGIDTAARRSWWARHKIATVFLAIIGTFLLISFVVGGTQV